MKHLDEGRLQAWLDQSRSGLSESERAEVEGHLSSCELCARKLEGLEESSRRLEDLFARPEQEEEPIPPFEAVVARAHHHHADRHQRVVWSRVGWAASVVVALGAGWIANELYGGRGPGQAAADRPTVERSDEAPAVAGEGPSSTPARRTVAEAEPQAARPGSAMAEAGPPVETSTPIFSDAPANAPASEPRVAEAEPALDASPSIPLDPAAVAPSPELRVAETEATVEAAGYISLDSAAVAPSPEVLVADAGVGFALDPGSVILRGRVTDESGQPLEAAQVFVEGTQIGTLTRQDGTFQLTFPELQADSSIQAITLSAQLLGYGGASRALSLPVEDPASADFRLSPEALSLDEVVVAGAAIRLREVPQQARVAVPIAPVPSSVWRSVSLSEVEAATGFSPLWVPDLQVVRIEVGSVGGVTLVRVVQESEDGGIIELVEGRGAVPLDEAAVPEGWSRVSTRRGDITIVATAPLPLEALEALLERLR